MRDNWSRINYKVLYLRRLTKMQYRRQKTEDRKQKTKFFLGFTLIELLVVISILGILAGFGVSRYILAEKQARDAERKSDLAQYRVALENFAAASDSVYPVPTCGNITNLCEKDDFATEYLSGACLNDPRASATTYYYYCSDSLKYALWATLESGGYYEVCSNGRSGKLSVQPATDGSCSLVDVTSTPTPTP